MLRRPYNYFAHRPFSKLSLSELAQKIELLESLPTAVLLDGEAWLLNTLYARLAEASPEDAEHCYS